MRRALTAIIGVSLCLAGCGDDPDATNEELVRYEISAGELKFEFGEPTDSVVPIPHSLLIVRSDGSASYEVGEQPAREFELDAARLSKLETDLEQIDFEEADDQLSGGSAEGEPSFTVTSDGTSVHLGDGFLGIASGEGPEIADRMDALLTRLDAIAPK